MNESPHDDVQLVGKVQQADVDKNSTQMPW
jgi:hypothetical protein